MRLKAGRPRRLRLSVERLEDRLAPAGIWDGGGTTASFHNALNWDDNQVPVNIPVTIGPAFAGITITSSQNVNITSLDSAAKLTISAGTFTLAADSTIANAFTLTGGSLEGA